MQFFSQVDSSPSVITDVLISFFFCIWFITCKFLQCFILFIYLFFSPSLSLFPFWHFKRIWKYKNMKINENICFIEWKCWKSSVGIGHFRLTFLTHKIQYIFFHWIVFEENIYFLVVHCSMDNWQPSVNIIRENVWKKGRKRRKHERLKFVHHIGGAGGSANNV